MAFVFVVETSDRSAVGQLQPALGTLQSLDMRFLIHAEHHGVLRRLQIERDEVGGLMRERWVGADAPAPPPRHGAAKRLDPLITGLPCTPPGLAPTAPRINPAARHRSQGSWRANLTT
jgi:hypothetical protein